jgi:glutamate-ammonia-ligase adenylyltransferase
VLSERLRTAALSGPDPEHAAVRVERFLAACAEQGGVEACVPDARAEELLALLCGQSGWLAQALIRDPPSLVNLARDPFLEREKDAAAMRDELERACAGDLFAGLRRHRNAEYLRLGARELGGFSPAETVARELSHLADACLDVACAHIRRELAERFGEPDCRFVVMAMGKHGGEELNFSSDVDLLFVYERDQDGAPSLHEFFSRLCERLSRAISDVTDDGYCFRVDLRLRPEGTRGPVCNSLAALESYYESWGRPWERQAWLKARPCAGDLALGEEALRMLEPFVWPRTAGPSAIADVHELMSRIRDELSEPDDIKLGPGGIREIEFFVQALQLVHARVPSVRERGTLRALDKLLYAGLVSERERRTLADAYVFLRKVEHRLQLDSGRQTHALPADRSLLARRLGFADERAFLDALDGHRRAVAEIYATLGAPEAPGDARALEALDREELELLRSRPQSPFATDTPLARLLLDEVAASPDPNLALRRLVDLAGKRGAAASIWRLVEEHRPLARLVASLFGSSELLGKTLVAHPELLEPLVSAGQAQPIRAREDLAAIVQKVLQPLPLDDEEARLNALRRLKNEELLRIGLYDIAGTLEPADVEAQLSDLAEVMIAAALEIAAFAIYRKHGTPAATLAVVGLGKLGGREIGYASDLDVIFIYSEGIEHFELFSRLAQRLIRALDAHLDEGRLYEIDTRLRPSGRKGALVSSLDGFRAYHAREAQIWERQALIKARTVAGDRGLGAEIEALAERVVYEAPPQANMAEEIGRLRARMEHELANETRSRFNIKTGRGGLVDVEFLVQYLQLRDGPRLPSLRVRATQPALLALAREGLLPPDDAAILLDGYAFLRRLEQRLRIVQDRSIQELPAAPAQLDGLARRMGYRGDGPGARLFADYRMHTERVRAVYARSLPAP